MADSYLDTLGKTTVSVNGKTFEAVAASYRGAAFFVASNEQGGGGRTVVTKKIPFSSEYVNEDLGGNVPSLSMEIFLVGVDCDVQKQTLLNACSIEGAGELVHPWLGTFQARCSEISFNYGGAELGIIRGSVKFVQESALPEKSVDVNLAGETKAKSKSFRSELADAFASVKNVVEMGTAAVNSVANGIGEIMDAVTDLRKTLASVNDFVSACGKIKANCYVLLQSPADLAARLSEILTATGDLFSVDPSPKEDCSEYLDLMGLELDTSTDYSGVVLQLQKLVQNLAASMVVDSLVDAEFASVEEAKEYQTKVTAAFDTLIENAEDVAEFVRLSDLQATALSYLRDTMANMAVVIEKQVKGSVNILSFVYDTYGSLDKLEDVLARNAMSQGLFVTGSVKVLSK